MNATMHARAGERQFAREREVRGLYTTQNETTDDTLRKLFEQPSANTSEEVPDAFEFLTLLGPPAGEAISTASLVEQQQTLTDAILFFRNLRTCGLCCRYRQYLELYHS